MKIRYVNRCVLSFRIISSCFQFIQICSSLTCRHCRSLIFNSRTNVVNDGVTTSCITSCIFERYDYVICSYVITSGTIKVCCIRAIWTFNNFITVFICVNSRCYSIDSHRTIGSSWSCDKDIFASFYINLTINRSNISTITLDCPYIISSCYFLSICSTRGYTRCCVFNTFITTIISNISCTTRCCMIA